MGRCRLATEGTAAVSGWHFREKMTEGEMGESKIVKILLNLHKPLDDLEKSG